MNQMICQLLQTLKSVIYFEKYQISREYITLTFVEWSVVKYQLWKSGWEQRFDEMHLQKYLLNVKLFISEITHFVNYVKIMNSI